MIRRSATLAAILAVFTVVYYGGAAAAFLSRQRSEERAEAHLAPLTVQARERLLVFAPHCDDETLGCAGLMQRTLARGGSVEVVEITNGDGYRTGVEREIRSMHPAAADYLKYAQMRMSEARNALRRVGTGIEVRFLGYPDRGLAPIWNDHWHQNSLYRSPYTACTGSPYSASVTADAPYCGASIVADIKRCITEFRPTTVLVTHPADDHPDHMAASAFVTEAMQEMKGPAADRPRLAYYLIHRGNWPHPQGLRLNLPLSPPHPLLETDTEWQSLALTSAETANKQSAIASYTSQLAMMGRFLKSFARRSEFAGGLPVRSVTPFGDDRIRLKVNSSDWSTATPIALDPLRDNFARDIEGGADLKAVYVGRSPTNLYVRVDTRRPVAPGSRFRIFVRPFGESGQSGDRALKVDVSIGYGSARVRSPYAAGVRDNVLIARIPLREIWQQEASPARLGIDVTSSFAGASVDSIGVRFCDL